MPTKQQAGPDAHTVARWSNCRSSDRWQRLNSAFRELPAQYAGTPLALIPHSNRINAFLAKHNLETLGDMANHDFIAHHGGIGRLKYDAMCEIVEFVQDGGLNQPSVSNTSDAVYILVDEVDRFMARRHYMDREMLRRRLGDTDVPMTLHGTGVNYKLTRERIRQRVETAIRELGTEGGIGLDGAVEYLARHCEQNYSVLSGPFIEASLSDLVPTYSTRFYLSALSLLGHVRGLRIPIWSETPQRADGRNQRAVTVAKLMDDLLDGKTDWYSFEYIYHALRKQHPGQDISLADLVDALFGNPRFDVDSHAWRVRRIQSLTILQGAKLLLDQSDRALSTAEINQRGRETYPDNWPDIADASIGSMLTLKDGFHRLGEHTFGLGRHINLSEFERLTLAGRFYDYLSKVGIPATAAEFLAQDEEWSGKTTAYVCAALAHMDYRFIQVGRRFLFALVEWVSKPVGTIRDLIVQALQEADSPMSRMDIFSRINQLRVAVPGTVLNEIKKLHGERAIVEDEQTAGYQLPFQPMELLQRRGRPRRSRSKKPESKGKQQAKAASTRKPCESESTTEKL